MGNFWRKSFLGSKHRRRIRRFRREIR